MWRAALAVLAVALSSVAAEAQTFRENPRAAITYGVDVRGEPPASMTGMLVTHATLQGLDVVTTLRGLDAGRREVNPLLKSGNSALIIGSKVAVTTASILLAKKLWKDNPKAAMVTMVAMNVGLSMVVAQNTDLTAPRR